MVEMTLAEAQLFRMLVTLFGRDRVVWSMSVRAVCGGAVPPSVAASDASISAWAEKDKCLFTIVDDDDTPKMVLEFAPNFSEYIEVEQLERQKRLPPLLGACGVQYVTMSSSELEEILDPKSTIDLVAFLRGKYGVEDSGDDSEDRADEMTEDIFDDY
jgi:hypothetical protein